MKTLPAGHAENVNPLSTIAPVITFDIDNPSLPETIYLANDNDDFPYGQRHTHETDSDYLTGDVVIPPVYNGHYYVALNDGTTSVSLPVFPVNEGGTVWDGTVEWQEAGILYKAMGIEVVPPTDLEQGLPEADIAVDNVGRELTDLIEATKGGRQTTMTLREVYRNAPDSPVWTFKLKLRRVLMTSSRVSGKLGYDDPFSRPAVLLMHDQVNSPGLF